MKKAQYSLEVLMTYGWALIVIGGVIGAIIYFGVTNPTTLVSNSCISSSDFFCKEATVKLAEVGNDYLEVIIQNQVGLPINITSFEIITLDQEGGTCVIDPVSDIYFVNATDTYDLSTESLIVGQNEEADIKFFCSEGNFEIRSVVQADIDFEYIVTKPGYFPKTSSVKVTSRVN